MMQKRVLAVYFSIIRRNAICAVEVMASASSRIMSLNELMEVPSAVGVAVKICLVPDSPGQLGGPGLDLKYILANVFICSRTTSMPRSSLALSSSTICRMFFGP